MSKALPWKLAKDVLSGDQRGRKPIEWSPVVANHVLSSVMNDGGSHPQPDGDDHPAGQQPLLANAGATSAQQLMGQQSSLLANAGTTSVPKPASALPLPAQTNISGSTTRKAQRTPRRRIRKFSTVAEVHAAATPIVAAPVHDQMELEEQPRPRTRGHVRKKSNDDPEQGKEGGHDQQVKKDKQDEVTVGSDDQVISKDDFVQGFMTLRPRIKGQNGSTTSSLGFIDFSLSLSKKEIEEDLLAMTGQKPHRRPTLKRPHVVQKRINKLFPGLDLDLVCPQAYAVEEEEAGGKRI